ncbi:MAG: glycosyltransferase family 25 protein [Sulfurimonas sp.]
MSLKDIPIFIINLKKDKTKKQHMEHLCKRHHLQCTFTEAVYGKELDEDTISTVYDKKAPERFDQRQLTTSEIGCALSHISIYRKMIEENIAQAVVFEDDIDIKEGFVSVLDHVDMFPRDWEMVLLGYYKGNSDKNNIRSYLRPRVKITRKHQLVRLIRRGIGAHGYLLNLSGAKKLIEHTSKLTEPIDHYTGDEKYLNVYAISPRVVRLDPVLCQQSNIEEDRKEIKISSKKHNVKPHKIKKEILRVYKQLLDVLKTLKIPKKYKSHQ